jgi:hypothetical protein
MRSRNSIGISIVVTVIIVLVGIFWWRPLWQKACTWVASPLERSDCLVPYFVYLTHHEPVSEVLAHAQVLQRQGIIDDCHVIAHAVGAANLDRHSGDPGSALATCSMGCIEGCYHGVMEAYVATHSQRPTPQDLLTICDSVTSDTLLFRQCIHGLGHGLLQYNNDVLADAVDACTQFPTEYTQLTCLGGVFMQNIQNASYGDEDTFLANVSAACVPMRGNTTLYPICTEGIGAGIMFYTGHDLSRSIALCKRLDPSLREQCVTQATAERALHDSILAD